MKKTPKRKRAVVKPFVKLTPPSRVALFVREHSNLGTTEIEFRTELLDESVEGAEAKEDALQVELNECRRGLKLLREDAEALRGIVESRR